MSHGVRRIQGRFTTNTASEAYQRQLLAPVKRWRKGWVAPAGLPEGSTFKVCKWIKLDEVGAKPPSPLTPDRVDALRRRGRGGGRRRRGGGGGRRRRRQGRGRDGAADSDGDSGARGAPVRRRDAGARLARRADAGSRHARQGRHARRAQSRGADACAGC
ncbi:hypothetical protein VHUM_03838 [Vanrija humicola]|uniref:Uncharacterized protein n=1 Tax=Vanrija humicola TaxID=5417 RepID=A0A7D8YV57_VANHU|nr:hypothetical protein VHUM_03838 [Vanrija humicola]